MIDDRPSRHQRSHYTVDDALTSQMTWQMLHHLFPFWLGTSFTVATKSRIVFAACYLVPRSQAATSMYPIHT